MLQPWRTFSQAEAELRDSLYQVPQVREELSRQVHRCYQRHSRSGLQPVYLLQEVYRRLPHKGTCSH